MGDGYYINDEAAPHVWRTEIPNILFQLGLSAHEYALYLVLKQTAGDDGESFKSTDTLAEQAGMSAGMVSKVKQSLAEPRDELGGKSLIRIDKQPNPRGGRDRDHITIVDIWPENHTAYRALKASSPHEVASSQGEQASSPHEVKKIPIKKNQDKKNGGGEAALTTRNPEPPAPAPPPLKESERMEADDYEAQVGALKGKLDSLNRQLVKTRYYGPRFRPYENTLGIARQLAERGVSISDLEAAVKDAKEVGKAPAATLMHWFNTGVMPGANKPKRRDPYANTLYIIGGREVFINKAAS